MLIESEAKKESIEQDNEDRKFAGNAQMYFKLIELNYKILPI